MIWSFLALPQTALLYSSGNSCYYHRLNSQNILFFWKLFPRVSVFFFFLIPYHFVRYFFIYPSPLLHFGKCVNVSAKGSVCVCKITVVSKRVRAAFFAPVVCLSGVYLWRNQCRMLMGEICGLWLVPLLHTNRYAHTRTNSGMRAHTVGEDCIDLKRILLQWLQSA